jgi:hypothetical protein
VPVSLRGARWSSGQCARRAIAEAKHRSQWPVLGWVTKIYYVELLRAAEGTLSRWSRLHLQSLAPTNPHWARMVGYGPYSLWVIHKEGLCPSSGDINRLMMMIAIQSLVKRKSIQFVAQNKIKLFCISQGFCLGEKYLWQIDKTSFALERSQTEKVFLNFV